MIVRQAPYQQRSARTQLDVALAAATLELPLELFFLGNSVWQLAAERNIQAAGLPRGLKGWGALAQMTEVTFFADQAQLQLMRDAGVETTVGIEAMNPGNMTRRWRGCKRVLTL